MNQETGPEETRSRETVLLVDDDPIQLRLTRIRLLDAGFNVETADGADAAVLKAREHTPDVIMSDVLMGDLDGFELCRNLRQNPVFAKVPILLLSAHFTDENDRSLAHLVGASALVQRTPDFSAELNALSACLAVQAPAAILSSDFLRERHLRANASQLRRLVVRVDEAETRYRMLFESAQAAVTILDMEGLVLQANEYWRKLGIPPESMVGRRVRDFSPAGAEEVNEALYSKHVEAGAGREPAVAMQRADGTTLYMEFALTVITVDGKSLVFAIGHDVTEAFGAAEALREAEERFRSLVERIPDVIWTSDARRRNVYVTPNVLQVLGYTREEMCAPTWGIEGEDIHPEDRAHVLAAFDHFVVDNVPVDIEHRRQRKDGTWIWVRNRTFGKHLRNGETYVDGIFTDITRTRRLEEGLLQAQKMEAVGQLTGGIAHDFNNMLAAILANTHFLLEALAENDPRRADALEIKAASERAAALTRQLLAFSRRQVLEPTNADLNATIGGLEKMLRRLISEDIVLTVSGGTDLGLVRVDVGQIEQVLMNLVVNARDAMPDGGTVTIETANVDLDADTEPFVDAPPGPYVVLSVSDSGGGMSAETKKHIFEPFFTTKGVGEGTGLGLSTCYGIVKQSGGTIWVYSELGLGTVFRVYLPRVGGTRAEEPTKRPAALVGGSETILVIEDDLRVRNAVARMLERTGYRVIVAADGEEALALANANKGAPIHVVLSDVIMPGMSGPDVVDALRKAHSGIRALFMSGYTEHPTLKRASVVGLGAHFIQKPFTPDALAKKVREVLDADAPGPR